MIPNWLWRKDWMRAPDGMPSYAALFLVVGIVAVLGLLSAWACLQLA